MVLKASEYRVKSGDIFFFDNNIWMLLYSQTAGYAIKKQNVYGRLLSDILQLKCCIWINSLILSEFINASLRNEYNVWKKRKENFPDNDYKKHFLFSADFTNAFENIKLLVQQILKIATKGNDDFNAINIDEVFKEMERCDFNDGYYLQYGKLKKYKIVTDDGDLFKNNQSGIEIITHLP